MKILLIANSIHKPGGAGRVEAYLVKALIESQYEPVVVASSQLHPHHSFLLPKHLKVYVLRKGPQIRLPEPLIFYTMLNHKLIGKIIEREKPQIVLSSGGMSKFIVKEAKAIKAKVAVYYHMIAPWDIEIRGFYRRYKWRDLSMLWFGLNIALNRIESIDLDPWPYVDVVFVNSKYMMHLAKRYWGEEPYVLQPPIEAERFKVLPREERTLEVISVGRLAPDKRYEDLIEAVGRNSILREVARIRLVGALENERYVRNLLKLIKKYDVKVSFNINTSEERKICLLSKSMVFVNSSKHEHFGINVVEAMASGTPVIVHKSGGPYFDIIDQGAYGLTYSTLDELASNIEIVITNREVWFKYSKLALQRAEFYDFKLFKLRLKDVLMKIV